MKRSRIAPPSATKRPRVPQPDRAPPRSPHLGEGPAPSRAPEATPSGAAPAAREPTEPQGSTPSSLFDTASGVQTWRAVTQDALLDLTAAAREARRRPRKRVLSRAEIRRQIRDSYSGVASFVDVAARSLLAYVSLRDRDAG